MFEMPWNPEPTVPIAVPSAPPPYRLIQLLTELVEPGAVPFEAILRFRDDLSYQRFLSNPRALEILGSSPKLRSARVGYSNPSDLLDAGQSETLPNYYVALPSTPGGSGGGIQEGAAPFRASGLDWLGLDGGESLGANVRVAVVDTGIAEHTTFSEGRVIRTIDLSGFEAELHGHGTAVASLIGGEHDAARGIVTQAELIDVRVADANGQSDSFTLAQGLIASADAGADVINVSLGSYGDSEVVQEAVAYAQEAGTIIVAAAGNDGYAALGYPAAYEGVISVGSVDAANRHLQFSNTSADIDIVAPGYEVQAAWPDEQLVEFTGTSASAPYVSGAIAAVLSDEPNLTGQQAYEIVAGYTNDGGAPGVDASYGVGILDVGRTLERSDAGIIDAGVASHYYAGDLEGNGREIMQVVVQNRGTERLMGSILTVYTPTTEQTYYLPPLDPGEITYEEVVIDQRRAEIDGQVQYSSSVTVPTHLTDQDPSDNQFTSTFVLNETP